MQQTMEENVGTHLFYVVIVHYFICYDESNSSTNAKAAALPSPQIWLATPPPSLQLLPACAYNPMDIDGQWQGGAQTVQQDKAVVEAVVHHHKLVSMKSILNSCNENHPSTQLRRSPTAASQRIAISLKQYADVIRIGTQGPGAGPENQALATSAPSPEQTAIARYSHARQTDYRDLRSRV